SSSAFGKGVRINTPHLSLGEHPLTAYLAFDSQALTATATIKITVSATAPLVTITSPANGSTFASDDTIVLRGDAFDYQDGTLPDSSLIWTDNGVFVGTGRSLSLAGEPQGVHTLTLAVTNSASIGASASITITVGPPAGNPYVTIVQPGDAGPSCQNSAGVFSQSGNITVVANAHDASGAPIPDANVGWTLTDTISGAVTPLGSGNSLTAFISAGTGGINQYRITVTVAASGKTSSDSILICVGMVR